MQQLEAVFFDGIGKHSPVPAISSLLDNLDKHTIGIAPWPAFNYRPEANFSIAHGNDCLIVKYYVSEHSVRANYGKSNEPVYKDSCVEFFISFEGEKEYYNFEFNCIGTCLSAFGSGRNQRIMTPEEILAKIKCQTLLKKDELQHQGPIRWELTLMIPLEVFYHHQWNTLKGQNVRINFYKCGDELPEPHFLSWMPIDSAEPNFHLPEFFGELKFM